MVKKPLKITFFLCLKKNCKQNLDSYCPDTAGPKYIHFLCVLTTQEALKYVQRCQLLLLCTLVTSKVSTQT